MRQAKASRRGLQRGIQRQVVGNRRTDKNEQNCGSNSVVIRKTKSWFDHLLHKGARFCFEKTFQGCSKFCLIKLVRREDFGDGKTYERVSLWKRRLHGLVVFLIATNIARSFWITWRRLSTVGMDASSAISLCGSWALLGEALISLGIMRQEVETAELLNSWSTILGVHTRVASVWADPVVCIQVIVIVTGMTLFPFLFPVFGLAMPNTPIFLFASMQNASILSSIPYWVWWGLFYPLEVFIYGTLVLTFGLTGQFIAVEAGIFKAITKEIRCVTTHADCFVTILMMTG